MRCSYSSEGAVSRASSRPLDTAGLVEYEKQAGASAFPAEPESASSGEGCASKLWFV
jgi:hypothetical protein